MDGFGIPHIHTTHFRQYVRFHRDNDRASQKMTGDGQAGEAVVGFNLTKDKFLLLFTAISVDLSLKQRDGNSRSMYARAYLSNLHSFSLLVGRPASETLGSGSPTRSSSLAFPARIWSVMVRSDKPELCSRRASIIRTCSWFDITIESCSTRP